MGKEVPPEAFLDGLAREEPVSSTQVHGLGTFNLEAQSNKLNTTSHASSTSGFQKQGKL